MAQRDPRRILERLIYAWAPVRRSAERRGERVALRAEDADWADLLDAFDDAEVYLRETQKPSGEFPQVTAPAATVRKT